MDLKALKGLKGLKEFPKAECECGSRRDTLTRVVVGSRDACLPTDWADLAPSRCLLSAANPTYLLCNVNF